VKQRPPHRSPQPVLARPLSELLDLLAEHRKLGGEPLAQNRPDDTEVVHEELTASGEALELLTAADPGQLVLVPAQQEETAKIPAVRLKSNRLEAFDLTGLLQPREILESLAEHLQSLPLAAPPRTQ
jgi:hypothetical protein